MPPLTFKLNTPTIAIRSENAQRTIVMLPKNGLVTLLVGDIEAKGFVQILHDNEGLIMFAEDLRTRGELVLRQSA